MKNIGLLFRHDLRKATQNVIAVIVLFGVVIIPSFFAWFNVLSSWNPFGNVKNLTVAVANADEGYTSDIFPMPINIGNQVIANLRANSDLNWVFTTRIRRLRERRPKSTTPRWCCRRTSASR